MGTELHGNKDKERRRQPPFDHSIPCRCNFAANPLTRILLILAGSLSLVLGTIGIFLPILPTTPFLLLAAGCFLRSSMRLYHWLLNHRVFGRTIRNYLLCRAVQKRTRNGALIILWLSLMITGITIDNIWIRLLLLVIGTGVTWHLLSLKTLSGTHSDSSETGD